MKVDTLLYPIVTLGPGNRVVIWTKGCTKHCKNCANPELWENAGAQNVSVEKLLKIVKKINSETPVEGITFTGGDPLEQFDEVLDFIELIKPEIDDILVYTGYTLEQLQEIYSEDQINRLQKMVSVLIDGPYIDDENFPDVILRGSKNQRFFYFDKSKKTVYETYMKAGRQIQNVQMGDRIISAGIHNREGENNG